MGSVLDITRKKYKEIKKYDRNQMEEFLSELYAGGVRDGFKNGLNTMIDIVDQGLKECDGIGEKRYHQIMESINKKVLERSMGGRNASSEDESSTTEES